MATLVLIDPFRRPSNGVGDTPPLPYYLYAFLLRVIAFIILRVPIIQVLSGGDRNLFFGVFYWAMWKIILPKVFGYSAVPTKEVLSDGTVVTVVSADNS